MRHARTHARLACVLLAAGGSRRLGRPKQLVRHRARPLIAHALAAAHGALPASPMIVVVGADALRIALAARRVRRGVRVVMNLSWRLGMASSLKAGLDAVPPSCRAALVLLVDQPRVGAAALRRLVAAWRRRPRILAAARYGGRLGVPAILPRGYWRAVRRLHGDEGARALLRGSRRPTPVDIPEAELDVDTPDDVARL